MSHVVAYIAYRGEPGEGALLVYADDVRAARQFAAQALAGRADSLTVWRHPPGDGLQTAAGCSVDPDRRRRAGLAMDADHAGLDCPSCGVLLGERATDPAPCLCPCCGFRICEGQV